MNDIVAEQKEKNYIFFSIGSYNYAFDSTKVLSVMQLIELEYPESLPPYVAGLFEYNDKIIKSIDLRKVLNLAPIKYNLNSKIIVVKAKETTFGVIAEDIKEIKRIFAESFGDLPYEKSNSFLEAIYTEKDYSASVINLDNIANKINDPEDIDNQPKAENELMLPDDEKSKEALHRRKLHYARKMREVTGVIIESQDTYITFPLDKNICCVQILHVAGFYKFSNVKIIEIPCTPSFIKGVVSLKGRYITIIDLLKFTENINTKIDEETSIIVLEHENYQIGILTGAIGETIDIDENLLKIAPDSSNNCLNACVVNDFMYLFLDINKLFSDERLYINN